MKVRFTSAARQDLKTIYLQGEDMFGRRQADAYATGMASAVRMIADYPLSSRLRHETQRPIRVRSYKSHVILYALDEAGVLVLRIRHGHEDWLAETVHSEAVDEGDAEP